MMCYFIFRHNSFLIYTCNQKYKELNPAIQLLNSRKSVSYRKNTQGRDIFMSKIIFKTSKSGIYTRAESNTNQSSTNPFGISFKGKILASDVFVSSQAENKSMNKMSFKGKLYTSAIVGSLVSAKNIISQRMNQVIDFVRNISGQVEKIWNKLDQIEIMPSLIKSKNTLKPEEKTVMSLMQYSPQELGSRLTKAIA